MPDTTDLPTPADVESERALLGAVLQDEDVLHVVFELIRPEDFYRPEHEALFALLCAMYQAREPIDLVTVAERILREGLQRFGGAAYVAELPQHAPSTTNAGYYARIIAQTAARRRTHAAALTLAEAALRGDPPLTEAINTFVASVPRMLPPQQGNGPVDITEGLRRTDAERASDDRPRRVPTGLGTLDHILGGGLSAGELVVVAGRPSWGKTSLALGFLIEHALNGGRCGLVSLEMDRASVVDRIVAQLSGVPIELVERGGADARDAEAIRDARQQLQGVPLLIDDRSGRRIVEIFATCRQWKAEGGLDLVVIDYLGLVRRDKAEKDYQAVGAIVKNCKHLARELQMPVVLCVQLNRATVAEKVPKKGAGGKGGRWWTRVPLPQLHHLADSGDVERDADKVLFPIPADVLKTSGIAPSLEAPPGAAVVLVAKNRNGRLGAAEVRWYGQTASFHTTSATLSALEGGAAQPDRHFSETDRDEEEPS